MKIQTVQPNYGNSLIVLDGMEIKFDHLGICELDSEIGNALLEKYPGMFWDSEKEVVQEKVVENKYQEKIVENLQLEIVELKSQLQSQKNQTETAIKDKNEWASLVEVKGKEVENLTAQLKSEKESYNSERKTLELKISLLESPAEKIKEMLKKSNYPESEFVNLNKSDLIKYVLKKQ